MAHETKEKDTALFAARERRTENSADYEGRMLINGELHWVNMWRNKTRNGDEYFRVTLKAAKPRADQIASEGGFGKPAQSYGQASGGFDRDTGEILDDALPF